MKVIETEPQLSVPVAVPKLIGSPHSTVKSVGQLIVGRVVSTMVIIWSQVEVLPQASVADQVRVITPVKPQAATKTSDDEVIRVPPLHASVAEAAPVEVGVVGSPHSTVTSGGQAMTGDG